MIEPLQFITHDLENYSHADQAKDACMAGVKWVQFRTKTQDDELAKQNAKKVQSQCVKNGAVFIINDRVELAHAILADGVHLGKSDMAPSQARAILGDNFIIGGTANNFDDIVRLVNEGVDYIGLGPFRFTETKKNLSPILGCDAYKKIVDQCQEMGIKIPLIAIGGILPTDASDIVKTGVHGIAVSSVIIKAENKKQVVNDFNKWIYENQ